MKYSSRASDVLANENGSLLWEVTRNLWHSINNPSGYVSLGMAENLLMQDELMSHVRDNFAPSTQAFTYGDGTTGSKRLKTAMAHFLTRHWKPHEDITSEHITITNGCSAALEHLAWALGDSGDGFLVGQPFFRAFIPTFGLRVNTKVVPVPCRGIDPFGVDIVAEYESMLLKQQAAGEKIAGIILCNPHNPLGRCYPRDVIKRFMELCQKYQINLISDEVYANSVWSNTVDSTPPPTSFYSCLSIDPAGIIDSSLIHVVWGVSKDFGSNGIRLGAVISQKNELLHKSLVPGALYSMCSSVAEHIFTNIFEDHEWVDNFLKQNQQKLAEHYRIIVDWAREHNITYAPGVNAGFFLWANLGKAYCDKHPEWNGRNVENQIMQLLLGERVFIAPGEGFGAEESGWFRLVFSVSEDVLMEGLQRIVKTILS